MPSLLQKLQETKRKLREANKILELFKKASPPDADGRSLYYAVDKSTPAGAFGSRTMIAITVHWNGKPV
jgi:hypothetical protein